jgi:Tat protein translocase TatB subunit
VFLFIFESIGTSELLLVGIVALIFLGPRKLPEYARKIGKITAEFRGTANEFKETWQREANFEEELKSLDINDLEREAEAEPTVVPEPIETVRTNNMTTAPAIKEVDPERLEILRKAAAEQQLTPAKRQDEAPTVNDKKNWL